MRLYSPSSHATGGRKLRGEWGRKPGLHHEFLDFLRFDFSIEGGKNYREVWSKHARMELKYSVKWGPARCLRKRLLAVILLGIATLPVARAEIRLADTVILERRTSPAPAGRLRAVIFSDLSTS